MSIQSGEIRTVAWSELFPWLMICRALRLATSPPILLVATIGLFLISWIWQAAAYIAGEPTLRHPLESSAPAGVPILGQAREDGPLSEPPSLTFPPSGREFVAPMWEVLGGGVTPVWQLFHIDASWRQWVYFAVGTWGNILVWAFFGAMIVRTAVMQFGRDERVGLRDAAQFAAKRYWAFLGAPLFPLAGIAVIVLCALPIGWLLRSEVGVLFASLAWIFVLLGSLLAAVVLTGLIFGWPLMWASLSAEEMGDVFEATQRSYSYTFGRPLHYALYALFALLLGSAAWVLVRWMAELVVYLSFWTVSWGAGTATLSTLAHAESTAGAVGVALIAGLSQVVLLVASAFRYAFFWSATGAIYLLLRRDSDQIDFDVVYVPDQPVRYSLPPLTTDKAGVPGVEGGGGDSGGKGEGAGAGQ
ncbi:MAG: hypothetical protein ACYC6N_24305 [Pirellulaceae bacterium]